jgi:hypothetical protein
MAGKSAVLFGETAHNLMGCIEQRESHRICRRAQRLDAPATAGQILLPETGLRVHELTVVINEADPLSETIGAYYQARPEIPDANLVRVRLPADITALAADEFRAVYRALRAGASSIPANPSRRP